MFDFRDLFQWERFITPSIIKIFYWLAVGISILYGIYGILIGLFMILYNPLGGLFWIITSVIGVLIGGAVRAHHVRNSCSSCSASTSISAPSASAGRWGYVANLKCRTSPSATT
jgi:hypothetical protein